jgi:hypothetical protein
LIECHCLAGLAKDLHQLVHTNTPCDAVTPASLSPRKRGAGVQSLPWTSIQGLGPRFRGDDEWVLIKRRGCPGRRSAPVTSAPSPAR